MTLKTKVAAVLVALTLGPTGAFASEILTNGGFETGSTAGWSTSGHGSVSAAEAHSGNFSFAAMGGDRVGQYFDGISVSQVSQFSLWAKHNGGVFDAVDLYYSDGSTERHLVTMAGNDWNFVNMMSFLNDSKILTGFGVYGTSPGPAYLDDFSLQSASQHALPEPATAMLVAFGLFGLARQRKQKR